MDSEKTMDFKGMRWVGNVYQKFEAMCLEVEEIIVQVKICFSCDLSFFWLTSLVCFL